jgi:hypothetical protein
VAGVVAVYAAFIAGVFFATYDESGLLVTESRLMEFIHRFLRIGEIIEYPNYRLLFRLPCH